MKCYCSNCGWLEINPSGAMFCGYSDERTWENESCLAWKYKDMPKTNADDVRSMTNEELAIWIYTHRWNDLESIIEWLRQENE